MLKDLMLLLCISTFIACQSSIRNVTTVMLDNTQVTVCDESEINETRETMLSELVEDFQVIRFENKEGAFFKPFWFYFSDNYICVKQDNEVAKLFSKTGKFIANIGGMGQGPGEYKFVNDVTIDEKGKAIYIALIGSEFILKYNMNGDYLRDIDLREKLHKPRLCIQPDSTLSLVHLCFKDLNEKFTGANIKAADNDSIQYIYVEALASNIKNQSGQKIGLNNEIWSYRNAPNFPFMMTHTDTLYHYDNKKNEIKACFTMKMDSEKKGDSFFIFNELPHHYFVFIVGKNGRTILVNKEKQKAYDTNIVNDYMGNIDVHPRFQDGYYYETYEPLALKEILEEHLASGNCPNDQVEKLQILKETLKENDNNLLLLGKLKN